MVYSCILYTDIETTVMLRWFRRLIVSKLNWHAKKYQCVHLNPTDMHAIYIYV